jgi:hypothetical protein
MSTYEWVKVVFFPSLVSYLCSACVSWFARMRAVGEWEGLFGRVLPPHLAEGWLLVERFVLCV